MDVSVMPYPSFPALNVIFLLTVCGNPVPRPVSATKSFRRPKVITRIKP